MKTTLQKNILAFSISVLAIGALNAQDVNWTGATDSDFSTATNWDTGVLPGASNAIVMNDMGNDPVLSVDYPTSVASLKLRGIDNTFTVSASITASNDSSFDGTLTIDNPSAIMTFGGYTSFAHISNSTVNLNAGTLNSNGELRISYLLDCTFNVNGGAIICNNIRFSRYGGNGTLNINSGSVTASGFTMKAGSVVNIDNGTLILNGDQTTNISTYVTAGTMAAVSGKTIEASYDAVADKTTVIATPSLSVDNASKVTVNIKSVGNHVYVSNVKSITDINVYSITGALVKTLKTTTDTDFNLASGIWIATVKTVEGQKSIKLLCKE
ncbi:hypothetical protein ACGK9U_09045 [Mariniflexile sp. HNIBRBA6329]|uniref:hypothetical protein n=1 Tax=Mariniflexile sp. HNIBRBA6329 TaxID=3373088 RepID=UPI0037451AB5